MPSRATLVHRLLAAMLFAAVVFSVRAFAASESDHDEVSGSYPGRILTDLALHRQALMRGPRTQFQTQSTTSSAVADVGNIVVMPDDGTLVTTANFFDLDQKSLSFQPSGVGYMITVGGSLFDSVAASQGLLLNPAPASNPQNIGDDGTREVALAFPFSFFGTTYNSIFINSDGNLTFGAGDNVSTSRSLGRFLASAPRIAPYFADLDPSSSGQLTYLSTPNRFVVTWTQVGDFATSSIGPRETFQVTLLPGGSIQFSYSGIHGTDSIVGLSPGHFADAPPAIDFSTANGQTFTGPAAEVFTSTTALDVVAVAQRFYQTHEDAYQYLVLFTNFEYDLSGAFAYELNIANQVTGLGQIGLSGTFDFASDFGSAHLESLLNMGSIAHYPANPSTVFLRGVDSTLSVMGQESGHRFEAYTLFVDPETGRQSTELLGRSLQHWSFFFNSDGSVVEGNRIRDNGNGTFTTIGAVDRYSELDQYLMGLREPSEVSPTFLVKNPSLPISPGTAPTIGVTFSGHRVNVSVNDIIAANGPRVPNSLTARKLYNYAFILVVPRGAQPSADEVAHVDAIRQAWEPFYAQATSFRAVANTSLVRSLGVVNGASFASGTGAMPNVVPGSLISIFGTDLASGIATAATLPLPTDLLETSVTLGDVAMPLYYVSPGQINAQVPFGFGTFPGTTATLTVHNAILDGSRLPVIVGIVPADPGIFMLDFSGRGAVLHNAGGAVVSSQNPARPGEFVQIYATGLGTVSPAVSSGVAAPSNPPSSTTLPVTVSFNGTAVPAAFAGLAPGFVALYQVNVQVPQIAPGTAQIALTINGVTSRPVTMAVGSN